MNFDGPPLMGHPVLKLGRETKRGIHMGIFDKLKGSSARDPLKNKAYFRKYIQQQEKRIDRFTNTLIFRGMTFINLTKCFIVDIGATKLRQRSKYWELAIAV